MKEVLWATALVLMCCSTFAEVAHHHDGVLQPYTYEPPLQELSKRDRQRLATGRLLNRKQLVGDSKRAIVLFTVRADQQTIWSVIRDFPSYPEWITDIKKTQLYNLDEDAIYVRFDAENSYAGESTWYARHRYPLGEGHWGSWTLDYSKPSDLDDSVGYWRVTPFADDPELSLVEYSATLKLKGRVPQFIVNLIVGSRLKQATIWVREQAEQRAAN